MAAKPRSKVRKFSLSGAFDSQLEQRLEAIRRGVDRAVGRSEARESLGALEETVARLHEVLERVSRRRVGDVAERLDELEYPFAKLRAFFRRGKSALDKRATEIMAEYVRDRMLEIRIVAKTLDARRRAP